MAQELTSNTLNILVLEDGAAAMAVAQSADQKADQAETAASSAAAIAEEAKATAASVLLKLGRLISTDTTKTYSKDVPSGANYSHIKKILGESVVSKNIFNQTAYYSGSGFTWNDDVLSATVYNLYTTHIMATADMVGKTYMVSADVYVPTGSVTGVNLAVTQSGTATYSATVTANGTWKRATVKWTPTSTSDYFYITYNGSGGSSVTAQMRNVQWELGTVATPYEPYFDGILDATPTNVVSSNGNSLPVNYGTLRSCGNVHDELDLVNGKIIRRVGVVDLGTLSWSYYTTSDRNYFQAFISNAKSSTELEPSNALSGIYPYMGFSYSGSMGVRADKTLWSDGTAFKVKDSAYTDATAFKQAVQGVFLNYELALPYEESINVIGNVIPTESGGTITFESLGNDYGLHVPLGSEVDHWYLPENIAVDSLLGGITTVASSVTELQDSVETFEENVNDSIGELKELSASKVDRQSGTGQLEWGEDALHISAISQGNYYETEIGGNGIDFKYGSSKENAKTVAKINQNALEINETIVFTSMQIGNWAWTVDKTNGGLMMRWAGEE